MSNAYYVCDECDYQTDVMDMICPKCNKKMYLETDEPKQIDEYDEYVEGANDSLSS